MNDILFLKPYLELNRTILNCAITAQKNRDAPPVPLYNNYVRNNDQKIFLTEEEWFVAYNKILQAEAPSAKAEDFLSKTQETLTNARLKAGILKSLKAITETDLNQNTKDPPKKQKKLLELAQGII
jgi:hypothetical protein